MSSVMLIEDTKCIELIFNQNSVSEKRKNEYDRIKITHVTLSKSHHRHLLLLYSVLLAPAFTLVTPTLIFKGNDITSTSYAQRRTKEMKLLVRRPSNTPRASVQMTGWVSFRVSKSRSLHTILLEEWSIEGIYSLALRITSDIFCALWLFSLRLYLWWLTWHVAIPRVLDVRKHRATVLYHCTFLGTAMSAILLCRTTEAWDSHNLMLLVVLIKDENRQVLRLVRV